MATTSVSSSKWHNLSSSRVTAALASAMLEWFLIFFLFIDAVFSYVITKFASFCKLQTPCLFCSRLDHVLGKEKRGFYWDLICISHRSEISSLVLCGKHDKLVNVQGMCESCLFSLATINESTTETYRLLVGKLGEESQSRFDQDPLLGEHSIVNRCSCCGEQWVLNGYDQRLAFSKSIRSRAADIDLSDVGGNNFHQERREKPFVSVRNKQVDPLSHVGYTELNSTSDAESESEVPLSDDKGICIPVCETDDTKEDIEVLCKLMEPRIVNLNEDLTSKELRTSASILEPSLSESGSQLKKTDFHGTKSAAATMESGNGSPSQSEPISFDEISTSSNKMGVPVEVSKEDHDLTTDEKGPTSEQIPTMDSDHRLAFSKSIRSRATDFDASDVGGNNFHQERRAAPFVSVRDAQMRNNQLDPLSHVGYTELKITSDTESESEVPLSDDDGIRIDREVPYEHMEPRIVYLNEDLAFEKLRTSASVSEPSLSESRMQLENTDFDGTKSAAATMESRNGFPSQSESISFNEISTLSNKMGVPAEVSKENHDLTTDEMGLTSELSYTMDCEEIIKSSDKLTTTTSKACLEPTSISSDIGQQNPSLLDLGDAYKLAISSKGRQLSGMLSEHWLGKDSSRISEDLKMLLSQFSFNRGTDLSVNDKSPRLSMNSDEVKASDVCNSAGIQILQKMVSLERNESGLSLDGSIVSEIEGESTLDRLKRQVDHDRKLLNALYKELEEERNASAVAASQALAMITRLQEEKAALHMEALQYLRMMDEESEYESEALQKANDLLAEKEKEIEDLVEKLEFYRKKFSDDSIMENMVEKNSEMKVKDIGLDQSQTTRIGKDESLHGKSVTGNATISDEAEAHLTSLKEKNVQFVKSSPSEFQDEMLYVSQRLKKLEKEVYFFLNIHQSEDNRINSEIVENESPENCDKLDNDLLNQGSVPSLKFNSDSMCDDDQSSKKLPVGNQNGELGYSNLVCENNDLTSAGSLVSDFIERLRVVEADQSFLEHAINLLRNGDEGIKLLQEIADHLQQLRRIGIGELDQPVA